MRLTRFHVEHAIGRWTAAGGGLNAQDGAAVGATCSAREKRLNVVGLVADLPMFHVEHPVTLGATPAKTGLAS